MGKENARNSMENAGILEVQGADAPRRLTENELKFFLGMGEERLSLDWPSVWGGESLKFLGDIRDSGGPGG